MDILRFSKAVMYPKARKEEADIAEPNSERLSANGAFTVRHTSMFVLLLVRQQGNFYQLASAN